MYNKYFISQLNEQILQMKQNMKELENAISEKEPYVNVAHIRLNNRIQTGRPELLGYFDNFIH